MSDITKKIFSIESVEPNAPLEKADLDVIRPTLVSDNKTSETKPVENKPSENKLRGSSSQEDVPKFVTRKIIEPVSAPSQLTLAEPEAPSKAAGWMILGFGILYLVGAGLYFGSPFLNGSPELVSIAGLVLLLTLPLILLFLLWTSLRHLNKANQQNLRVAQTMDLLVSPDHAAASRTKTLTAGIQAEISKVNTSLDATVETLKTVQLNVAEESQSLDAAGLQLSTRSEDVGRNLTLQREALETASDTLETKMDVLSSQVSEASKVLDVICSTAETKLIKGGEALQLAAGMVDQTIADSSQNMTVKVTEITEISQKLDEAAKALTADIEASRLKLTETDETLINRSQTMLELNESAQSKIYDLKSTIEDGNSMLSTLQSAAEARTSALQSYYYDLSEQLKKSEDETLAAQGKTARMVESNLAKVQRDFARMETDMQVLQNKIDDLKVKSIEQSDSLLQNTQLKLIPLENDFPPVQPSRVSRKNTSDVSSIPDIASSSESTPSFESPSSFESRPSFEIEEETPLNLDMDLEIHTLDEEIKMPEADVIRRPGHVAQDAPSRGFGRRSYDKQERSGWRWRDMLGGLDRPDGKSVPAPTVAPLSSQPVGLTSADKKIAEPTPENVDAVAILTDLRLSPSAIVDEGTVIDATQARVSGGDGALASMVSRKLPEAVNHLREKMASDTKLTADLMRFNTQFSRMISVTPPTAPALRASLGSPDGRAYLLIAAALKI